MIPLLAFFTNLISQRHLSYQSKPLHGWLIQNHPWLNSILHLLQELTDEYQSMFKGTGGHSVGLAWFRRFPFSVCRCQRFYLLRLLIGDQFSILLMTDRTLSWHVRCIRNASLETCLYFVLHNHCGFSPCICFSNMVMSPLLKSIHCCQKIS